MPQYGRQKQSEIFPFCVKECNHVEDPITKEHIKANAIDLEYHRLMGKLQHKLIVENLYTIMLDLFALTIYSDLGQ